MIRLVGILLVFMSTDVTAAWLVKQVVTPKGTRVESSQFIFHSTKVPIKQRSIIQFIDEGTHEHHRHGSDEEIYEEWIYPDSELPVSISLLENVSLITETSSNDNNNWDSAEVRTFIKQGPSENRIDLTFVGDGYTEEEREKFFQDAQRLTDDLFTEVTFKSYLALFNVHAVFVPSNESGLTDLVKKDTAFGLYRSPKGSKRAVMPGKRSAIERALRLAPGADYPILVANDDFYGGLGGRYAITTRSLESGSMVLRHELGHNFGEVGEEYDGGYVYSGANANSGKNLKWNHWINGEVRRFETKQLSGHYVWQNLSQKSFSTKFDFPDGESEDMLFDLKLSSVGWKSSHEVDIILNGEKKNIQGHFTTDRSFFKLKENPQLSPGVHRLEIRNGEIDDDNVLAFARTYAYPADIITDDNFIGGYATFDANGRKTYRPTFEGCLMRDMSKKKFCSVDQENMWFKLMRPLKLIDGIAKQSQSEKTMIALKTLSLENIEIKWFRQGIELLEFRNKNNIEIEKLSGRYKVTVEFKTPEVRKPGASFTDSRDFEI